MLSDLTRKASPSVPEDRRLRLAELDRPELEVAAVIVILVAALVLRLFNLTRNPFWYDEAYNAVLANQLSFFENLTLNRDYIIHPPLFYVVLHFWTKYIGLDEFPLRLLSVVAALLTLGLFYRLARRWLGRKIGLSSLALLAVSPLHLNWSQSIRPYAF